MWKSAANRDTNVTDPPFPQSELILYQTEHGRTRIQCRFEDETLWLSQLQMAELFQTSVPNINLHLKAIYEEGELLEQATIKSHLIVGTTRRGPRPANEYVGASALPPVP